MAQAGKGMTVMDADAMIDLARTLGIWVWDVDGELDFSPLRRYLEKALRSIDPATPAHWSTP